MNKIEKKTYSITTYGCDMNKSDSERLASALESLGYSLVKKNKVPDLLVFNSCSVRQSAVDRIYGQMGKFTSFKKKNPDFRAAVTGCILPKDRKKLLKRFDFIFNIKDLDKLALILKEPKKYYKLSKEEIASFRVAARKQDFEERSDECSSFRVAARKQDFKERSDECSSFRVAARKQDFEERSDECSSFRVAARKQDFEERSDECSYFKIRPKYHNKFSCLVPISFGCNRFCTYCAVPYTRGLEINRPSKDILNEVKELISEGPKEIILLGQTVSSWQDPKDKNYVFVDLLKDLEKLPGKFWIRFNSPYVLDFNDKLIDFLAEAQKINNYLNLPIQSGNNQILKKMKREYSAGQYLKVLSSLKDRVPDFSFSTDIIVGFCGETEKQFQDSFNVFKKISPSMAYIAKYSTRPGTVAAKIFKDSVPLKIKKQRHAELTRLLRQTSKSNLQKEVGRTLEVLVNDYLPNKKECLAKTRNFKAIRFKGNKKLLGKFVKVKIVKTREFELEGKLFKN